jgi:hypothetical protein
VSLLRALVMMLSGIAACRSNAAQKGPSGALVVHNALRGDLTLVEDPAGEAKKRVLPCAQIGRWAVEGPSRDGKLVALDTEKHQLALVDLGKVQSARCAPGEDLVTKRVPLHGGAVPYRARLVGDRLFVSFFSENRLEVYRFPDLAWERDVRFDATENLGLSDMDADGSTLLVTAAGYVCFERHCPGGHFRKPHLYFLDTRAAMAPPFVEAEPTNVNALSVLADPPYVVSAGDLEGGYGSLQRIRADRTLGPEIRLPAAAGPETAHPIADGVIVVHQMAGEHLFFIDTREDKLRAILRFDGHAFVKVPLETKELPERTSAEIQDLLVDPKDPSLLYLVEMKSDRFVRARFRPKEWALDVEKVVSLSTESFRSATQWMVWLP